jgi:hypothetical protein
VNARRSSGEQLRRLFHAPSLNFFRAEARDAYFGHPHRKIRHRVDRRKPLRPLINLPKIPIERETVNGNHIHILENAFRCEGANEMFVDRRDAAKNPQQARPLRCDRPACGIRHAREQRKVGIDLGIPVRFVVRFVPDFHRFDHQLFPRAG